MTIICKRLGRGVFWRSISAVSGVCGVRRSERTALPWLGYVIAARFCGVRIEDFVTLGQIAGLPVAVANTNTMSALAFSRSIASASGCWRTGRPLGRSKRQIRIKQSHLPPEEIALATRLANCFSNPSDGLCVAGNRVGKEVTREVRIQPTK